MGFVPLFQDRDYTSTERLSRVGGGALARWPPSATQTVCADFPRTAFTKTHFAEMSEKVSIEQVRLMNEPSWHLLD